jgi:hypothetical protein
MTAMTAPSGAVAYHADDDMDGAGTADCCLGPAGRVGAAATLS